MDLPALDELVAEARSAAWPADQLVSVRAELYGDDLKEWMGQHNERLQELNLLNGLDRGELTVKGPHFTFRGTPATTRDVKRLLTQVNSELDADQKLLADRDRRVFLAHYQMAQGQAEPLVERYRFHLGVQAILRYLIGQQNQVNGALSYLANKPELSPEEFQQLAHLLGEACQALAACHQEGLTLYLPALRHMETGQALTHFLFTQPLVHPLPSHQTSIDGKWIGRLLEQLGEVVDRAKRIHFKSLGGILQMQEAIHADWTAGQS